MKELSKLILAILLCELVGIIATPFTISAIPTWYQTLNKPFFSPPNWIFGPAWTTLYFLMGVSVYLVWKKGIGKKGVNVAIGYFSIQLILNFFWSLMFFGFRSPILGLLDIVLLWVCIAITMIKFWPISKAAFYLLVPYIFWVSFAAILNVSIVLLNSI